MMVWIIESYIGANQIKFGMTSDQVSALLGKPESSQERGVDGLSEFRSIEAPIIEYTGGAAMEFIFSKHAKEVQFKNINVFLEDQRSVLSRLLSLDPGLVEVRGGSIVSKLLGVSLSGFQDDDDSNKSFGAFGRGVWDRGMAGAQLVKP